MTKTIKRSLLIFLLLALNIIIYSINVFAEEYDFHNGLLDNTRIIDFNNLPIEVYDNDLNTEERVSNNHYIRFNTLVDVKTIYFKRGEISPFTFYLAYYDENSNLILKETYSTSRGDGYFEVNRDNVLEISFMHGSTNLVKLAEFDVFGTYDLDIPLPNIPKDITNLDFEVTTDTATFNYDLPSDEDFSHLNVYFNNEVIQTTDTTFILENLSPNTDYEITFKTVNKEGTESLGTTVNFKTNETPTEPQPQEVKNLKIETSKGRVDLTWQNPEQYFDKAIIYRKLLEEQGNTSFSLSDLNPFKPLTVHADETHIPIFETNGTEFSDLTVEEGKHYEYKVTTMYQGKESNGVYAQTYVAPPPLVDTTDLELPFGIGDLIASGSGLIGLFSGFIILGLTFLFVPKVVKLIKDSFNKNTSSRRTG